MSDALSLAPARRDARALAFDNRAILIAVSLLMFAPSILLALHLRPLPALAVLAACLGALAIVGRARAIDGAGLLDQPFDARRLALSILIAATILVLGGAMHFLYAPHDWRIRDAVLGDLVASGFPLAYNLNGVDYLLRAPLGMYMLPAAVGRLFGIFAAHVALFTQNGLMLGAIFYLLATIGRGWRQLFAMLAYAGCSLVGIGFFYLIGIAFKPGLFMDAGLDSWNPYFQYSASLIQFFWVPNHALPGWWLAVLVLLLARRQIDVATLAASIGGALFWSPLAILPAAVWTLITIGVNLRESLSAQRLWLVAPVALGLAPVAAYLTLGAASIDHGVLTTRPMFWTLYGLFVLSHCLQIVFLLFIRALVPREYVGLLAFSIIVLTLLPLFTFGPANDLAMRGATSAQVLIAFLFANVLFDPRIAGRPARWIGLAILVVCAPSALLELTRAATTARYPISDCSLFEAAAAVGDTGAPSNYVVEREAMPGWLLRADGAPVRPSGLRQCWPDHGHGATR